MCMYVKDMKFLWSNLWLEGLSTDDTNNNDTNETTQQTIHDYVGSLA